MPENKETLTYLRLEKDMTDHDSPLVLGIHGNTTDLENMLTAALVTDPNLLKICRMACIISTNLIADAQAGKIYLKEIITSYRVHPEKN